MLGIGRINLSYIVWIFRHSSYGIQRGRDIRLVPHKAVDSAVKTGVFYPVCLARLKTLLKLRES